MAVKTTRTRTSITGRVKRDSTGAYVRTRAAIGLGVFVLLFGVAWFFNGLFTAERAVAVFGVAYGFGWAIHIAFTAIELLPVAVAPFIKGLPKSVQVVIWLISLPFGAFDVYSSAYGLSSWMEWTKLEGIAAHVQNVGLGEILAFMPEPMIFFLLVLLVRTLRP